MENWAKVSHRNDQRYLANYSSYCKSENSSSSRQPITRTVAITTRFGLNGLTSRGHQKWPALEETFFFAHNLYWGKENILAQSCSLNQCASNDIHFDIKNWDLTLGQGQLFTWIGSTMYQSVCLWYRHSDIHFVFALHFDRKLLRKTFAELRWLRMTLRGISEKTLNHDH